MSDLRGNMLCAAILIALLVALISCILADFLVSPKTLEKNVLIVEIPENMGYVALGTTKKYAAAPDSVSDLLESANIEQGARVAKKCVQCHSFKKGVAHKIGPNLWNIVGSAKAAQKGYKYSAAASKQKGGAWSYESLNAFLYKPRQYMPGTKMSFAGLKKRSDRANLIAYLRQLSNSPQPLP